MWYSELSFEPRYFWFFSSCVVCSTSLSFIHSFIHSLNNYVLSLQFSKHTAGCWSYSDEQISFQPFLILMSIKETSLLGSSVFFSSLYRKLNYQPRTPQLTFPPPQNAFMALPSSLFFTSPQRKEGPSYSGSTVNCAFDPTCSRHFWISFLSIIPSLSLIFNISPSLLIIPLWPTVSKKKHLSQAAAFTLVLSNRF